MTSIQDALNLFKKFKYFFDIRGIETHELDNAPDGWRDTIIEYNRSKEFNGVFRSLTLPYKFVKNAAFLCRREYAKYGLMAKIIQRIELGDGRNGYSEIYRGRLDISTKQDTETGFTVSSKTADFSANIDAYGGQKYSLSLEDGKYVELTPIKLNETATLIISGPPDGILHADYFPPIRVVNNQVNSVDPTVYNVDYGQLRNPSFAETGSFFYKARVDGNLYIKGSGQVAPVYLFGGGTVRITLDIVDAAGIVRYSLLDRTISSSGSPTVVSIDINVVLPLVHGDTLFIYSRLYETETPEIGLLINALQLDLSYQTITPATMCKGLTLSQIFGKLLQQMNVSDNSGPLQPIPYQSYLFDGLLKDIVVTSSDSIRSAQGSIYVEGNTLFQGIYLVLSGTANYNGGTYTTGQQFTYTPSATSFTGDGIIEKITAIYAGVTYNPGDTLQAGGTYLAEGSNITYNAVVYTPGQSFKYVLGQDTFTAADSHGFVKQIAADPQLVITFKQLIQTVKSIMGGNFAFGVDKLAGNPQGLPFIEGMSYVFRDGNALVDLGNVDKEWKSFPAVDLLYNSIKAGYEDQQYDAINGQQEVNSTQYYGTDLLNPVAELDLIAAWRADCLGIETARVTGQDTAASRSDNDPCMIWINPTPVSNTPFIYYKPLGLEGVISMTGVSDSYYNYFLSPKQNLLRGGPYLASIFYNMKGYQIKLTGYEKNVSLVTVDLNGRRVAERDPINIADLPKPYFIPEYCQVNKGLTTDVMNMLDINPYGEIRFTVNGKQARAFINDVKVDIGKESVQELKLLLTSNNNLMDFVR